MRQARWMKFFRINSKSGCRQQESDPVVLPIQVQTMVCSSKSYLNITARWILIWKINCSLISIQTFKVSVSQMEKTVRKLKKTTKMTMMSQARRSLRMRKMHPINKEMKLAILLLNNEIKDGQLSKRRKHSLLQQFNRVLRFKRNWKDMKMIQPGTKMVNWRLLRKKRSKRAVKCL